MPFGLLFVKEYLPFELLSKGKITLFSQPIRVDGRVKA